MAVSMIGSAVIFAATVGTQIVTGGLAHVPLLKDMPLGAFTALAGFAGGTAALLMLVYLGTYAMGKKPPR